jgi:hypothetical protein
MAIDASMVKPGVNTIIEYLKKKRISERSPEVEEHVMYRELKESPYNMGTIEVMRCLRAAKEDKKNVSVAKSGMFTYYKYVGPVDAKPTEPKAP